jgi:hypothetical protein
MNDKPLVPPKTPMCQEYLTLMILAEEMPGTSFARDKMFAFEEAKQHRASCELCKARIEEFNELARNALEPEVSDV